MSIADGEYTDDLFWSFFFVKLIECDRVLERIPQCNSQSYLTNSKYSCVGVYNNEFISENNDNTIWDFWKYLLKFLRYCLPYKNN